MDYPEYLKRRDELAKIRTDSFVAFDKAILSLATGGLALSITFLDKIGAPFDATSFVLISIAWVSYFIVILANLFSYLFAKANMDKKLEELDSNYTKELATHQPTQPAVETQFWQRTATNVCNVIALGAFAFGTLFFLLYIGKIQRHNFSRLTEVTPMAIKKTAGQTEITSPISNQRLREGQTEIPAARPVAEIKGQTEIPQAIPAHIAKPTTQTPQTTPATTPATPAQPNTGTNGKE